VAQRGHQHSIVAAFDRRRPDIFDPNAGEPPAVEIKRFGGSDREVDDAVAMVRTAIIDAHDDGAAVVEVGDSHIARQRQRGVRGRDAVHCIDLAVGGPPAVEVAAVPRRDALDAIGGILGRDIGAPVDVVGLAYAVDAAALRHRLALLDDARAVFLAGKWPRAVREHETANGDRADAADAAETEACELAPHSNPRSATPPRRLP